MIGAVETALKKEKLGHPSNTRNTTHLVWVNNNADKLHLFTSANNYSKIHHRFSISNTNFINVQFFSIFIHTYNTPHILPLDS